MVEAVLALEAEAAEASLEWDLMADLAESDMFVLCAITNTRAAHVHDVDQKCSVLISDWNKMSLDDIRKKVIFHNSVDVWITACGEKNLPWTDTADYKKFISHLLKNNLNLKAFNLCAHDAGATEEEKTKFAETLAETKDDPTSLVYTIKLNDSALEIIRSYF